MFSKSFFVVAIAALAQLNVVLASPPGCLLGAVNSYDDPSNIAGVCKEKDATSKIAKLCGDSSKDALAAFADICNSAGVKVATDIPTATATGTGSSSATASANGTVTTGTGGATPTGPTSTGAAQHTGAANALEMGTAALLAGLGLAVAAL